MSEKDGLELAEAIDAIRRELLTAQRRGQGSEMPFELGPVELEFSVTVSRERSAEAALKVWVVEAGGSLGRTVESAHRVSLVLKPKNGEGGPVDLGD
ncbi:trypco2 family protein [Catelliglobosispora koreensis]|uniref:trypco2 family protein n=1 Tax=Catelliglobosispora koreensis TaxID=129052 RepID=UPI000373F45A|nr:trypco2 family protein [Catelliglobosispora koreensis]